MIEIWLFGWLLTTLSSALSLVLLLVALTSVTYLATTLAPVLGAGPTAQRAARLLGLATAAGTLLATLAGMRVGSAGAGGELIPTLALSVALAAAGGGVTALSLLGGGAAGRRLGAAQARRRALLAGAKVQGARQLEASRRAFHEGADLHAEVAEAEASLARLRAALDKLSATHAAVEARLAALDDAAAAGALGNELRRTRDEIGTKLDLGRRIQGAAAQAAYRLAVSALVRTLLRRRPRDLTRGLSGSADGAAATRAALATAAALDEFLAEVSRTREALGALAERRPTPDEIDVGLDDHDDAHGQAVRDLEAIAEAYGTVRDRLAVVAVRAGARADMEAVAAAAGEVSDKARASGIPAGDLQDLVDEVARAESAILMATPAELDAHALTEALGRSAAALGGHDGASLDALLQALREVS
jgi:hypothetical protein